ncbi:hypothetical protein ACW23B_04010 [Streptomyces albidoflavus]
MREGYGARAPMAEEAEQVAALVHEAERSQDPTAGARTPAEFRAAWSRLDLARDARVATAPDGTLAGYAQVDVVRPAGCTPTATPAAATSAPGSAPH